jgi:hypothetical protein
VSVAVIATNPVGNATASSASVGPVSAQPAPPVDTSSPTISGTAQQGATLTADPGTWSGTSPITYAYIWSDGTVGSTDKLSAADVGKSLSVTVTASNSVGKGSATSATFGPVSPPDTIRTTTALLASPNAAVTNEPVTLFATVTSSNSGAPPSGTITLKNGATSISGCANQPIVPTGQSVTVTCQTSFAASTAQLTAVFAPSANSNMTPSASTTDSVTVGQDSTSAALDVSKTANVGASTTYTATVTPPASRPGPIGPTGSVEFLDGVQPIASCLSQPLSNGGATCAVTYKTPGTHSIKAVYWGDTNFTGSVAPAQPVSVVQVPAHVLGSIGSTMQWAFYYTPSYTAVLALVVNGASGATVLVGCHGRGCPFATHATLVKNNTVRCVLKNGKRTCPTTGKIDLAPAFRKHHLHVNSQITVMITRRGWIGKYYLFIVRARRGPHIQIACLPPGASRPGGGC